MVFERVYRSLCTMLVFYFAFDHGDLGEGCSLTQRSNMN